MSSISISPRFFLRKNPNSLHFPASPLCFRCYYVTTLRPQFRALKASSDESKPGSRDAHGSDLLRRPVISPIYNSDGSTKKGALSELSDDDGRSSSEAKRGEEEWVDWEDKILEDTVPLVGFVRMILHSGKYGNGDKLSPEHEKAILERLLPYHPEFEKKIGCGIDFITVGYHPDFENSRCLFIARKDGELVDFSFWKCIKGLIRKNYPLYADSFILRHFRMHNRKEQR